MENDIPLKDIILPEPVGWWPPALGWWLLLVLIPLLAFLLWRLVKWLRRKTAVKTALKQLKRIQQDDSLAIKQKLAELSILLRRVAISTQPVDKVAGLTGKAWLEYLDQSLPGQPFSHGVGQCLGDLQYQPDEPDNIDLDALFRLCQQWIKKQR